MISLSAPMHMLITWLVMSAAIWLTSQIVPGFRVEGIGGALWVAALFGLLHFFLGWIFFVLIGIGTLGLGFLLAFITRWIVTAIVLKITDAFSSNLTIRSFGTAFVAALVMSALTTLGQIAVQHLMMGPRSSAWRLSAEPAQRSLDDLVFAKRLGLNRPESYRPAIDRGFTSFGIRPACR